MKYILLTLLTVSTIMIKAQTTYFGLGGAITVSKINFTGSDGKKSDYTSQLNFSQNLGFGYNTKGGFSSELNFGNSVYSGINKSMNHELSLNEIQTSLLLGYLSPGKLNWGVITGVYYGKITMLKARLMENLYGKQRSLP